MFSATDGQYSQLVLQINKSFSVSPQNSDIRILYMKEYKHHFNLCLMTLDVLTSHSFYKPNRNQNSCSDSYCRKSRCLYLSSYALGRLIPICADNSCTLIVVFPEDGCSFLQILLRPHLFNGHFSAIAHGGYQSPQ